MAKSTKEVKPVQRTSAGLRDAVFDELDAIRAGTSSPTKANAVSKLATTIVETVRMELEAERHLRNSPAASKVGDEIQGGFLGSPPLVLGKKVSRQ